jgi:hypothetical protein
MARPPKTESASVNCRFRRAPRQKSIASRMVDFPLSPGPIRQLMPAEGDQVSCLMLRKFSIVIWRIRAMECLNAVVWIVKRYRHRDGKADELECGQLMPVRTRRRPSPEGCIDS